MKTEYHEKAYAVEINLWESAILKTPSEGNVSLMVSDRNKNREVTLECFVYEALDEWSKIKKGNSVLVQLILLNWQYNTTKPRLSREKSIRHLKGYEYQLTGEVLELSAHPSYKDSFVVMLDCGVYVKTRAGKNAGLKVGDYMSAEGRLDAHIVGKVK